MTAPWSYGDPYPSTWGKDDDPPANVSIVNAYHSIRKAPASSILEFSIFSHAFVDGPVLNNTDASPGQTTRTPGDSDGRSQYDRQLENVTSVLARTVLPGNMLVFGSPDSAKMADLIIAAFTGGRPDALKGSQVLFIGQAGDSARVQAAVTTVGGKYIFVEAR